VSGGRTQGLLPGRAGEHGRTPPAAGGPGLGSWAPGPAYRGLGPTHPGSLTVLCLAEISISLQTRHIWHDIGRPGPTRRYHPEM
jgi:hypothetical protein